MNSLPSTETILASPCTSYWLKDAIRAALSRDCLDALRDAETLAAILKRRVEGIVR
jgi:hypothetical protein